MLHWSRLAVFWRESKRFPNVPNGATKGFTDVFSNIWMHHRPTSTLKDSYATMEHVTPITAANKRSLDIKNVQFSHLLIFSLRQSDVVGRRLEKDVQSGELVVLVPPREVSQQQWLICQILASRDFVPTSGHHLQFGTLPCSLACTHSAAKWNGFCSGDNTRGRGCLCSYYVSYALSQRVTTSCNEIKVVEAS